MVIGNPEKFKGIGLVGFIDILGFSKEIEDNWDSKLNNPLQKLLNLKDNLPKHTDSVFTDSYKSDEMRRTYLCRVQTISDSIIISFGFDEKIIIGDLMLGMSAFFDTISVIWFNAIAAGFTIRGAVDIGNIYWDESEIVGPAFINAFKLEQTHAKTSRIILSSTVNNYLSNVYKKTGSPSWKEDFLDYLCTDIDGYIILNPHCIYSTQEEKEFITTELVALRNKAKLFNKEKYTTILAMLSCESKRLKISDIGNY